MKKENLSVENLRPIERLHYLSCFAIDYRTKSGKERVWELVSRGSEERLRSEIFEKKSYTDGAMVLACDEKRQRVVLLKEYRVSAGRYVYMFPAGLIEEGEDIKTAAAREFKEETGMILDPQVVAPERYVSVGIINEKVNVVYGFFHGEPSNTHQADNEEAEIVIVDRKEARRILEEEEVSIRSALLLEMFFSLNPFLHGGE